jgi:hypothetical protein
MMEGSFGYVQIMTDPGGPETYGSYRSGSGTTTLVTPELGPDPTFQCSDSTYEEKEKKVRPFKKVASSPTGTGVLCPYICFLLQHVQVQWVPYIR